MENIETQTGTETSETDLLTLAMKADAGEISADEPLEGATSQASEPPPAEASAEPKPDDTPAEEKTPEAADPATEPGTKPEGESNYAKARKELERQDRSWKKLEEEKVQLRAERDRLERERLEVESGKARASVYRDDQGYSAADYEAFARQTDDADLAAKARDRAGALRGEETRARAQAAHQEFAQGWKKHLDEAVSEHAELKDESSPLGRALQSVLRERPVFSTLPDGIKHAVVFAKAQSQAGLVPGLEAKVKQLETEIARLNKLTAIPGSAPSQKPGIKSFEDMSATEQDAELERMAAEADRGVAA